jgi:hypothetical protein
MKFKLSSLLLFVMLIGVVVGLSYQVYSLREQVVELRTEVQNLRQQAAGIVATQSQENSLTWHANNESPPFDVTKEAGSLSNSILSGAASP